MTVENAMANFFHLSPIILVVVGIVMAIKESI
jgi:hypothetical protein